MMWNLAIVEIENNGDTFLGYVTEETGSNFYYDSIPAMMKNGKEPIEYDLITAKGIIKELGECGIHLIISPAIKVSKTGYKIKWED